MQGRTLLVAAHRLSTIASCDLVAVFEAGVLLDVGGLDELVARGTCYGSQDVTRLMCGLFRWEVL